MLAPLRVLVGCATSGVGRRAFEALGHDAWSCDLLPSQEVTNKHIIGDIREVVHWGWDLLAVLHPTCTRLCLSGVRWLHEPPRGKSREQMWRELDEGAALFSACINAPIEKVAVENPRMHRHAMERIVNYQPPAQVVQPWWFGDEAFKATGLYLKNLPPLVPTLKLAPPAPGTAEHRRWSVIHRAPPSADRWQLRSRTFSGMAEAMAMQWAGPVDALRVA